MISGTASEQYHGIGINRFQSAYGTDLFSCLGLHVHPVRWNLQHHGYRFGNRSLVGREFRAFGMNRTIQIYDAPTSFSNGSQCRSQKDL